MPIIIKTFTPIIIWKQVLAGVNWITFIYKPRGIQAAGFLFVDTGDKILLTLSKRA